MKYRKKPVVIEAMQWDGSARLYHWIAGRFGLPKADVEDAYGNEHRGFVLLRGRFYIHTLEGMMEVSPGDYVIQGVKGEVYPCKPDIFMATYEEEPAHDQR